jgi:multisubunit Na+/H+ antiporter MnhG subunit
MNNEKGFCNSRSLFVVLIVIAVFLCFTVPWIMRLTAHAAVRAERTTE